VARALAMLTRGRQDSRSRERPSGDRGVSEADVLILEIDEAIRRKPKLKTWFTPSVER
jgi:hypothetical protein